jgi:hypothetical protein
VGLLEPADEFIALFERLELLESSGFDLDQLVDGNSDPLVVVPAVPPDSLLP